MKNKVKKINKTSKIVFITFLSIIVFVFATYAWFTGITVVTIEDFSVKIQASEGLNISLDADTFDSEINIGEAEITTDLINYENNTNSWLKDKNFRPISTIGQVNENTSRLNLFQKKALIGRNNGYELITKSVDNSVEEKSGYVVFDIFLKNQTSDINVKYSDNYNHAEDEPIYLTYDSAVSLDDEEVGMEGIENSVRIAFVQIGRVPLRTNYVSTQNISCKSSHSVSLCNKNRGETWNIWEPNDIKHTEDSINHFDRFCFLRENENTYGEKCQQIDNDEYVYTYAVKDEISKDEHVNIYDGLNGYLSNQLSKMEYFKDSDKEKTMHDREAIFYLAKNSITKLRVYIYMEGQDIDNYDFGRIERKLNINFGFSKYKYEEVN